MGCEGEWVEWMNPEILPPIFFCFFFTHHHDIRKLLCNRPRQDTQTNLNLLQILGSGTRCNHTWANAYIKNSGVRDKGDPQMSAFPNHVVLHTTGEAMPDNCTVTTIDCECGEMSDGDGGERGEMEV